MRLDLKPEVLAPAGTLDAVAAVLDAGADAVYLGGKKFNMRLHRTGYNLRDDELASAIALAHERAKKLYVTVNNLMLDSELEEAREVLTALGELRPDAIIVQDLAVAALAREVCVHVPLHASTMMNVHSVETAKALKLMGFKRIITSRDIPLHEVRRIGEGAGLEMEYFVHGDLCIAQSGQCHMSGVLFGESSNRGRCMKPCRWEWKLVTASGPSTMLRAAPSMSRGGKAPLEGMTEGYLLARKDLCLFQHIPALVQNGIVSLKIEGRMRTAELLVPVVVAYREAVDAYFSAPVQYVTDAQTAQRLWSRRVREFTTAHALYNTGASSVDPTGAREPRLFSQASPEPSLTMDGDEPARTPKGDFELVVRVGNAEAAEAAAEAGAEAIYLGGDDYVRHRTAIAVEWLSEFAPRMAGRGVRVAVLGPRVGDERDLAEWRWRLRQLARIRSLAVGVSNLGALQVAREMRVRDILADFSLNVCNSVAADELSTLGATRVTASIEMNFLEMSELAGKSRMPVEVIGQGALPGMVLEHCVIAAATGDTPQGVCPMNCRRGTYDLCDATGQAFRIEADRRCRNHIFLPADVCVLPNLSRLAATGAAGLRIEAPFEDAGAVAVIVGVYRQAIDALRQGLPFDAAEGVARIGAATGRRQSDGPFAFHLISEDVKEDSGVIQSADGG